MIFEPCFQAYLGPGSDLGLVNATVVGSLQGGLEPPLSFRRYTVSSADLLENVFFDDNRFFSVLGQADGFSGGGNIYIFTTSVLPIQPNIQFYSGNSLIGSIRLPAFSSADIGLFFTIPVLPIKDLRISSQLSVIGTAGSTITLGVLKAKF